jgi:hypothetical protein
MLYRNPNVNKSPNTKGGSIGRDLDTDSKRAVPRERDGAKNPYKAMVRLGEEFNINIEQQKRAAKMENKALLK